MTAVGFLLFVFGVIGYTLYPPTVRSWEPRDAFGALPIVAGMLLLILSAAVWLWRVAP